MLVKPVGSKLFVKIQLAQETQSGLLIVRRREDWQEETITAVIEEIGPDCSYKELKIGTVIIIAGHAGKWVDNNLTPDPNVTFRIIDQDEIIAYLEEQV